MKTFRITSIFTLVLVAHISFGQSSQVVAKIDQTAIEKNLSTDKKNNPKNALSLEHSKTAVDQIKKRLANNLIYPETMLENGLEGQVVLKVNIGPKGTINEVNIAKSVNTYFDKVTLTAMQSIKTIHIKGENYFGASTVYVPINFSIGQ